MLKLEIDPMRNGYKIDPELVITTPTGRVITLTPHSSVDGAYVIDVYNNEDQHANNAPLKVITV